MKVGLRTMLILAVSLSGCGADERASSGVGPPPAGSPWGIPVQVAAGVYGNYMSSAFDSQGRGVVAWLDYGGSDRFVRAVVVAPGQDPLTVNELAGPMLFADQLQVAVNSAGDALVLWREYSGGYLTRAARFTSTGGWQAPETIFEPVSGGEDARPAIGESGHLAVAWAQTIAGVKQVWVRRFDPAAGWASAELVSDDAPYASAVTPAVGSDGAVMAVWTQYESGYKVWANRFDPIDGWGVAQRISDSSAWYSKLVRLFVGSDGSAICVWVQDGATTTTIQGARFEFGAGWQAPTPLSGDMPRGGMTELLAAFDSSGRAAVAWTRPEGYDLVIESNHFDPSTGWGTSEQTGAVTTYYGSVPQLDLDAQGTAWLAWERIDALRRNVYAVRKTAGQPWSVPVLLENAPGHAVAPVLCADGAGGAIVAWLQSDGALDQVWSSRYSGGAWTSAERIGGREISDASALRLGAGSAGACALWVENEGMESALWMNSMR